MELGAPVENNETDDSQLTIINIYTKKLMLTKIKRVPGYTSL